MCLSCGCYGNSNFKFPFKFSKCSHTKIDPPAPQLSLVADIAHPINLQASRLMMIYALNRYLLL